MKSEAPFGTAGSHERRLTAEHVAARALLAASTIDEAAPRILEAICRALDWEYGGLWAIDRQADVLRCVEVWCSSAEQFAEFRQASRGLTFRPGVGLPGRVWQSRQPAWIPDVTSDTNFPRAPVAAREGLHAAFGFPVLLRGEVLSVMEFFSREIREPDEELLSLLMTVGSQIGMFMDRRGAQEELDRFFNLSLDLLCVAGFDGYLKRVNPAWQRSLGFTEEELLSSPYVDRLHPDDRAPTIIEARKLIEGRAVMYFENRHLHKDGTWRWLLWTAAPYPEQQVFYAAGRDITERKAAEETLALYARDLEVTHRELEDQAARLSQLVRELETSKRRAEEAAEVKSAFLANMSHEIRTPLNAILGMTTLALKTRLTNEQRDYLSTVKSSAEALIAIISDILDFSKIEARRLDLERTEFNLRDAVGDAAKVLALRASEKGLELACDVGREVPATVVGDPGRLRQVLLNVIGNAVKFTSAGEVVVRVTVDDDTRGFDAPGSDAAGPGTVVPGTVVPGTVVPGTVPGAVGAGTVRLRFAVRDTGVGIPRNKQQDIFRAFTQADSSTTRRFGGTGLGLAIASRLVELMGGRIWLESEPGHGSTFHFTARFDRPATASAGGPDEVPRALQGLRVLVVDDNATNRRIVEEMLASWHMLPTSASDAVSALGALQQAAKAGRRYEAVIADCQMPDVDGFMLARRVKRHQRLRDTPVIMLTSVGRADDAARVRRLGIDAYLTKPVTHSDLFDTLTEVFAAKGTARLVTRAGRARSEGARPSPRAERRLRILVAEDHAVNRKLVTTLLRTRGHTVKAVENGRAAVGAIDAASERFDVVVMDLQMPEMGGLEATQAIRALERPTGSRVPILALTAHALRGDRERCLQAGMDEYMSKPIDADQLTVTVERLAAGGGSAPSGEPRERGELPTAGSTGTEGQPASEMALDEVKALSHCGGNRRLLADVIGAFRRDCPVSIRRIERALARADGDGVRNAAHALKGSAAAIGASATRAVAAELEDMGRQGQLESAGQACDRLRDEIRRLDEALVEAGLNPGARQDGAAKRGAEAARKPVTRPTRDARAKGPARPPSVRRPATAPTRRASKARSTRRRS